MTKLSNEDVQRLLAAARTAAKEHPGKAFATCIADSGGHVLGLVRDVGAAISAGHSAETKARTAIYLLTDTGGLPPTSPVIPAMTVGLPYPINFFPGGLLIRRGGDVVGAIGVGGSSDPGDDAVIARAALDFLDREP